MRQSRWTTRWQACLGLSFAVTLVLAGCGKSDTPSTASETTTPAAPVAKSTPTESVKTFLSAIKDGNDNDADRMLTALARQKTQEADLYVAPPGSATASFEVGEFEVDGKEAQVFCTWSDVDEDGNRHTDKIVWLLRNEPEGWRISGMATELFPGEDPLILNFENPEEMIKKQRAAEEEMIRRATATLQQTSPDQPVVKQAKQTEPDKQSK